MCLPRRNSICASQMLMRTQHLAAVTACARLQGCVLSHKIALLSITACQLLRGPIRLAAPSTQSDMKQMRNKAQMIMCARNICEGVECFGGRAVSYKQRRNEEEIPHSFAMVIIPSQWQGAPRPRPLPGDTWPRSRPEVKDAMAAGTLARSLETQTLPEAWSNFCKAD